MPDPVKPLLDAMNEAAAQKAASDKKYDDAKSALVAAMPVRAPRS